LLARWLAGWLALGVLDPPDLDAGHDEAVGCGVARVAQLGARLTAMAFICQRHAISISTHTL
jgi:hypothetical protein